MLLFATQGCHEITAPGTESPIGCTRELIFGIVITAKDAATGGAIHPDAIAIVREGAYEIRLEGHDGPSGSVFEMPEERAGTYTVRIEAPGYRPWQRDNVQVIGTVCHVRPVQLTALLER